MFIRLRLLLAFLGGLSVLSFQVHAQSDNASISGTITDSSGAVLPHATVTISNEANGQIRTATSNDASLHGHEPASG